MTAGDDHALARELAAEAGRRLLELRARGGEPGVLRDAGDRLSHEFLAEALARRRPGDAVLSEEAADDPARLSASRLWIVDPLDGTREFGEPGRTDWAVHVALWERAAPDRDGDLAAGAVSLPAQGKVLSTAPPGERRRWSIDAAIATPMDHRHPDAAREAEPVGVGVATVVDEADRDGGGGLAGESEVRGTTAPVRIVVSRSRAPRFVRDIAELIGAELMPWGSAGAKVAAVLCGDADAYVHGGGFYEWDTAAPVAVARAAGYHASRIDGSALAYNQTNVKMPDILICRPALAGALLEAIREVTHASPS